jgi:hypothetical protein
MLFYSHVWDLILKLSSLFAVMIVIISVHGAERLGTFGVPSGAAVWVLVGFGTVVWLVIYRQGLSTLAAWLYATVSLGARVSLAEARRLARLFQLDLSLKWVPLKEVRRLPRPERRDALLTALGALGPHRKAMLF